MKKEESRRRIAESRAFLFFAAHELSVFATQTRDPKLARRARLDEATRVSPIGDNRWRGARTWVAQGRAERARVPTAYYQRACRTPTIRRRAADASCSR